METNEGRAGALNPIRSANQMTLSQSYLGLLPVAGVVQRETRVVDNFSDTHCVPHLRCATISTGQNSFAESASPSTPSSSPVHRY